MLLVSDADSAVPLFDTTRLHALAAVERAWRRSANRRPTPIVAIYSPA